jgi:hypothetical protein
MSLATALAGGFGGTLAVIRDIPLGMVVPTFWSMDSVDAQRFWHFDDKDGLPAYKAQDIMH